MVESKQDVASQAFELFNKRPKRYNCAQVVAVALGRDDLLEHLKSYGSGRAPYGLCGALYAATLIAGEEKSEIIKEQFQKTIGHCECKLIKQTTSATCNDCVQCAAVMV